MVTFSELPSCKSYGRVFSNIAGSKKISKCPQYQSENFDIIEDDRVRAGIV